MRAGTTTVVLLAALLLGGCLEDFDPASRIEKTRVLGARVEIEGAEGRVWPRPGERVELPWLVVFTDEARELESLFVVCAAAPTSFGVGFCEGDPLPTSSCDGDGDAPCVSFEVPEAEALGEAQSILVLGGICADGTPVADPQDRTFECRGDDAEGTPVTFALPVQREDATNAHPEIEEARFEGDTWQPLPEALLGATTEGCPDEPALPTIEPGEPEREIAVTMRPESFETFTVQASADGSETMRTEEMEVSSFATAGELERQRIVIDGEETSSSVMWTPPAAGDVPDEGLLVRFHFVARDERAGITWTHRGLCVR